MNVPIISKTIPVDENISVLASALSVSQALLYSGPFSSVFCFLSAEGLPSGLLDLFLSLVGLPFLGLLAEGEPDLAAAGEAERERGDADLLGGLRE